MNRYINIGIHFQLDDKKRIKYKTINYSKLRITENDKNICKMIIFINLSNT